ncbi:MAG TPA: NAD(+) synthase, partial [candidate division Zixibacteria bacterium]|nr:NAD(+) synthase [candidate division Zixibacteria bacterium]
MRVTLAQLNPTVGDIAGNLALARRTFREHAATTDLVVFPEMFLVGYPAQDLLDRPSFISRAEAALDKLAALTAEFPGVGLLIGAPLRNETRGERRLYNAALLYADGKRLLAQKKTLLPTYDVFDEGRYFQPAEAVSVVSFKGETLGVSICEDAWTADELWPRGQIYARDPLADLARQGATLMINISASPFAAGKERIRYKLLSGHARRHKTPLVVVNQVGGNDELVFDGQSMAFDNAGRPSLLLESFVETVTTVDTNAPGDDGLYHAPDRLKSIHDALVFGLKDYARKCGFTSAVVGLSGGLDSAVTLALATEVFGAGNMLALSMPSRYSSKSSVTDAEALAANLGVECHRVPIDGIFQSYLDTLATSIDPNEIGVTQENLQARIRGNILMAFSNKYGYLCLATGNKSEL